MKELYFNTLVLETIDLLAIFRHAESRHFTNIGPVTNAFWAVNDAVAERKCMELAEAGVTYFEVSIDFWHQSYVSNARVRTLLRAMRRTVLRATLRTLSSRVTTCPSCCPAFPMTN
jgi:hypothetical protein